MLSLLTSIAAGAMTVSSASPASADRASDPQRPVCVRMLDAQYRRTATQVCKTAAEWKQVLEANRLDFHPDKHVRFYSTNSYYGNAR